MRMLSEACGHRVSLMTPQRGAKMDLIRLANKNAVEEVERATSREERASKLMEALGRMLGLPRAPGASRPMISPTRGTPILWPP